MEVLWLANQVIASYGWLVMQLAAWDFLLAKLLKIGWLQIALGCLIL